MKKNFFYLGGLMLTVFAIDAVSGTLNSGDGKNAGLLDETLLASTEIAYADVPSGGGVSIGGCGGCGSSGGCSCCSGCP